MNPPQEFPAPTQAPTQAPTPAGDLAQTIREALAGRHGMGTIPCPACSADLYFGAARNGSFSATCSALDCILHTTPVPAPTQDPAQPTPPRPAWIARSIPRD